MDAAWSREQVRDLDRRACAEFGVPGIVLMENAGRGTAELLRGLGIHGRVLICCGPGNNGGDGMVIARHLDNWHVPVSVLLFARPESLRGDAATNFQIVSRSAIPLEIMPPERVDLARLCTALATAEWTVDALFGTGLRGPVQAPFPEVIELINGHAGRILAVDIPTGLDCDTGEPAGATIRAHHTATFVGLKKGFLQPPARPFLEQVHVIGIGAPRKLSEERE